MFLVIRPSVTNRTPLLCPLTGGERPAVQGVRGAAEGGHAALPDDFE